ncbi:alpha-ketoglutarate-dependent dioxygenase AlkB [Nocardia sp. GCM10030253]|uniref:alpha-ketoglutarate-dependent dioxygenase AlkB n=1 Tax=Nocardia sp. GCM10030253 TaxID=3273404 RepID=UPI003625ED2F
MPTDNEIVPGLRYLPRWLDDDEQSGMLAAIDAATWSTELRRRVQHYGHRYDYGRRAVTDQEQHSATAPPLPDWALSATARLHRDRQLNERADQVIVNEYQPGQGISAHVDCVPCFGPEVAAISLGSAYTMDFLDPDTRMRIPVRLEAGSLIVMTGPSRYRWRHAIAPRKSDMTPSGRVTRGRRVSVTFRTVLS